MIIIELSYRIVYRDNFDLSYRLSIGNSIWHIVTALRNMSIKGAGTGSTSTGNVFKLDEGRAKYDLRKHYFTNRVFNAWNSLPDHVVLSDTTNTFK